ncbi:hypothetical protein [Anaplasma phagocytophilum]
MQAKIALGIARVSDSGIEDEISTKIPIAKVMFYAKKQVQLCTEIGIHW